MKKYLVFPLTALFLFASANLIASAAAQIEVSRFGVNSVKISDSSPISPQNLLDQQVFEQMAKPTQSNSYYLNEYMSGCAEMDNCFETSFTNLDPVNQQAQIDDSTIRLKIVTVPPNGTDFIFDGGILGNFTLDNGVPDDGDEVSDNIDFNTTSSVEYDFVEQLPIFWELYSILCSSSSGTSINLIIESDKLVGIKITPGVGDEIICTFYNQFVPAYSLSLPIIFK